MIHREDEAARRAADRAARRDAQTMFGPPLLVEAGAGTGKTSVLVARVLAWCLGPGWQRSRDALAARGDADDDRIAERVLERVTAITFTEAAAAQMERRIGQGLRALAAGAEALPHGLEREALPAPELWVPRSRALLASFDRLHVSTIHAWCRRLLAKHPIEAGVHPRFAVDERGLARARAAREAVETWLVEAGTRRDPALVELVAGGVAAPELEEMLIALLADAVPASTFRPDPVAPERIATLVARLRHAALRFVDAEAGCLARLPPNARGREVATAVRRALSLLDAARPRDAVELARLLDAIRESGADWESALERLRKWGLDGWNGSERAAAKDRVPPISAAAADLAPLLRHAFSLEPILLERLHAVLHPLLARAEARLRGAGAESFDALLRRTQDLLERHPEVSARIRAGIDQLLVDEFQDTDAVQCAIVERLALRELPPGTAGPGLFVVGDPKQSIYGWRNADLAAYQAFRDRLEAAGGELRRLCVNRRSSQLLLDEVARVIAPAMVEVRGVQPVFEDLLAAPADGDAAPPTGALEYWISSDCDGAGRLAPTRSRVATEREATHLADDLLRAAREGGWAWRWEGVGILLRSMADADVYLEALRRADVPYVVGRDRSYSRRREVIEASALVRAVLDPSDQIALVATLRSAWVGVPDAAWRPLWANGFPDGVRRALDGREGAREPLVRAVRASAAEVQGQPIPGLERLDGWEASLIHALDVLVALRRSFEGDPAECFVEKLRTLPLLDAVEAARSLGAWRLANLDRFFRELGTALEESGGDPAPVLRGLRRDASRDPDWDEGRAQHPSEDAVQVMTVHGAKGLEFDHVYLMQLHKGSEAFAPDSFSRGRDELAGEWRLAAGRARVRTLGFDEVEARRERVAEAERVRALYVAMTRARKRLVLAGGWESSARGAPIGLFEAVHREPATAALSVGAKGWVVDAGGVRWRFLALAPPAEIATREIRAGAPEDGARVRSDAEGLAAARRESAARSARALGGSVSEKAAEELRESAVALVSEQAIGRAASADAHISTAVGTALHGFLERFDWSAERASELARQRAWVFESLARTVGSARLPRARERAERVLESLVAGPLWLRLQELAPCVIGRELPVLLPCDGQQLGPVAYSTGAIDLVYRDVASGDLVVVDFKSDAIDGESMLAERALRYRPQGRAYCRALAEALRLERPPRFELWFLDAGRVVEPDSKRGGERADRAV